MPSSTSVFLYDLRSPRTSIAGVVMMCPFCGGVTVPASDSPLDGDVAELGSSPHRHRRLGWLGSAISGELVAHPALLGREVEPGRDSGATADVHPAHRRLETDAHAR